MFDFIKKLFKKSHKSLPKKKNTHLAQTCKPAPKPDRCCKKDEAARPCPTKPTCESDPAVAATPASTDSVKAAEESTAEVPEKSGEESVEKNDAADTSNGAYVIKVLKSGIYKFDLTSPDGKTVVRSGEYTLKRSCVSGIQSVQKNGATENVEDRTVEKIVKMPNPKYEIFMDESEKYRFSLKAPNGYVILTSSAYSSKKSCLKAIENVKTYSQTEKIEEQSKVK